MQRDVAAAVVRDGDAPQPPQVQGAGAPAAHKVATTRAIRVTQQNHTRSHRHTVDQSRTSSMPLMSSQPMNSGPVVSMNT
jgi:hypothetical protein